MRSLTYTCELENFSLFPLLNVIQNPHQLMLECLFFVFQKKYKEFISEKEAAKTNEAVPPSLEESLKEKIEQLVTCVGVPWRN